MTSVPLSPFLVFSIPDANLLCLFYASKVDGSFIYLLLRNDLIEELMPSYTLYFHILFCGTGKWL